MKNVLLGLLVALTAATTATAAPSTGYTGKATSACLTHHRVLVSPEAKAQVLPPKQPAVAVFQVSMALIPAQALDNGYLVFERNAATAKRVAAAWYAYSVKAALQVKGVDLSMVKIRLSDVFTVRGNTITTWANQPVKAASRRLINSCLR